MSKYTIPHQAATYSYHAKPGAVNLVLVDFFSEEGSHLGQTEVSFFSEVSKLVGVSVGGTPVSKSGTTMPLPRESYVVATQMDTDLYKVYNRNDAEYFQGGSSKTYVRDVFGEEAAEAAYAKTNPIKLEYPSHGINLVIYRPWRHRPATDAKSLASEYQSACEASTKLEKESLTPDSNPPNWCLSRRAHIATSGATG